MGFPWSFTGHKEVSYSATSPDDEFESQQASYLKETLLPQQNARPNVDVRSRRLLFVQRAISLVLVLVVLAEAIALYQCKTHLLIRQTPVPEFLNVERTWVPDQRYAHKYMFSDRNAFAEVYRGWGNLFPSAMGMIPVNNGQRYIENPPYQTSITLPEGQDAYMIAGIHQLHCLRVILSTYGMLRLEGKNDVDDAHLAHCFDYLRQGLMCSVDTSLEGNSTEYGEGWGSVHVCKDYSKIVDWIDQQTERTVGTQGAVVQM
ncbi:uncharacterized protein Z520_07156 [Fonsecaea multimorphosa CBS 102226]|uniref:Oxidase ustYa n=1 Tax=Fonsecaea multimorphosa CBS 102226 TaxID=1442371 RepID=A0A0D2JU67_9EURO|nr:uncharacterized protein Z520_07156 [Fonsecaea multimorphosa CBS 102226]KIX97042.1 hypothetical protein Z520_07156 [Fonsecaea multimorphosa CBS 102226]OAL22818.1 hypothetical protein AYO22_06726 [Fonsecaea multimorphosa]